MTWNGDLGERDYFTSYTYGARTSQFEDEYNRPERPSPSRTCWDVRSPPPSQQQCGSVRYTRRLPSSEQSLSERLPRNGQGYLSSPSQPPDSKRSRQLRDNDERLPFAAHLHSTSSEAKLRAVKPEKQVLHDARSILPSRHDDGPSRERSSSPATSGMRELVNFKGLRAVPTGPKPAHQPVLETGAPESRRSAPGVPQLLDVGLSVRASPHAFLSGRRLPPHEPTLRHLHGYARRYKPRRINVDRFGYYFVFDDTREGHANLDLLVDAAPKGDKIFGIYAVVLEAFHRGQTSPRTGRVVANDSHADLPSGLSIKEAAVTPTAERQGAEFNHARNPEAGLNEATARHNAKPLVSSSIIDRVRASENGGSSTRLPSKSTAPARSNSILRSSSPRVPSRQERDDASSVSGRTAPASELSATTRYQCHVCDAVSNLGSGALVPCSSCPRQWHRRCHGSPPIPANLDDERPWQCRRCVKKSVEMPRRLGSVVLLASASAQRTSNAVGQTAGDRLKLQGAESERQVNDQCLKEDTADLIKESIPQHRPPVRDTVVDTIDRPATAAAVQQNESANNILEQPEDPIARPGTADRHKEPTGPDISNADPTRKQHQVKPQSAGWDEASALVDESFSQTEKRTSVRSPTVKEPVKLKLTRVKLARDPYTVALEDSPKPLSQATNLVKCAPTIEKKKTREADVRRSEVPESPVELRNPVVAHSQPFKEPNSKASKASVSPVDSVVRADSVKGSAAVMKPKAKRTKQSYVKCSECKDNLICTSNPHAQALCLTCKRQQQQVVAEEAQKPVLSGYNIEAVHRDHESNSGIEDRNSREHHLSASLSQRVSSVKVHEEPYAAGSRENPDTLRRREFFQPSDTTHHTTNEATMQTSVSALPLTAQTAITEPKVLSGATRVDIAAAADTSLVQLLKLDAEDIDYSAKSLFEEWPQCHHTNQVDRQAKMIEIKQRPSRKLMFGKPAMYSRLAGNESPKPPQARPCARADAGEDPSLKRNRFTRRAIDVVCFPKEAGLVYYDTLEEFFGMPNSPVPMIYNGQLAYRQGTRDDKGKLRRAQAHYSTGPDE